MRGLLRTAGLLAVLAVVPAAKAADASGTWKGSFGFQGGTVDLVFHLTVAGSAITGTVEGLPTTPAEIHDGKAEGNTVTFWVNTDYQGETYKLVYRGTISTAGNEIGFSFGTEDGAWGTQLTAEKSVEKTPSAPASDVSGTWNGAFEFNGQSVPLTIHLTSGANGAVTGTVEGLPTTPAEIHDGKVDGDTVTFWVSTDYEGDTYRLDYKGKIGAGQIVFQLGNEAESWGTQLTVTKETEEKRTGAGAENPTPVSR
ncbi:MAG: hypothetical protein ABSF23_09375 [Terracidiphilus sp.]